MTAKQKAAALEALRRAVESVGGASVLARGIGVSPGTMGDWLSGRRPVPVERCPQIESHTARFGRRTVNRERLRPDVNWRALAPVKR